METVSAALVIAIVLAVFAILVVVKTAVVVPQQNAYVVERLGKFHAVLDAGFHVLFPFIDVIRYRHTLKEQAVDIPEQICITKDNVQVAVDGILYLKVLDPQHTELRRNSEWLGKLDFAGILKYSSMFTVARVLERDDFQKRYSEQRPIALHEFLYPVMQAYDSVCIRADVELGGTDQLFNLLAGRELMEKLGMEPQVCLTLPLLEGTDGVQKMSKSYGNYVGLTDEPDDMFGKVMSIPDELMVKYYRLATSVSVDDIELIEAALAGGKAHPNVVKRRLAREIVGLYHGEDAAAEAEAAFDRVFKRHEAPEGVPVVPVEHADPVYLPALLKDLGLVASASEGRRQVDGGAVKIDGEAVAEGSYELPWASVEGRVVQVGKRRYARPETRA